MAALHVLHVGMGVIYSNECPLSILAAADREGKEAFMRRNQGCISTPVISTPTSRSRFMRWLGNVHRKAARQSNSKVCVGTLVVVLMCFLQTDS